MNVDTLKYYNEANVYWKENGYDKLPNCGIINHEDKGWMWIREYENSDNGVHLSRFVVDEKRKGIGTKMINILKDGYNIITAWGKPETFSFYISNGFEVQYDSENEYGYYYIVWDKYNR